MLFRSQLEERVGVALDPDHMEPIVEGFRGIAVGDPSRGLVHGQETEPDGNLAPEVRPTPGQETMAGCDEDAHGNLVILTPVPDGIFQVGQPPI